jgi:hypothetical protein
MAHRQSTPAQVRSGIYLANIEDTRSWGVSSVLEGAITLSRTVDTAQATDISHSAFSSTLGNHPVTFDYWAFTAGGHRYLLSYAHTPAAKTPTRPRSSQPPSAARSQPNDSLQL